MGQWCPFNLLIGNMNGHAKNISMLYKTQTGWLFSPLPSTISSILLCMRAHGKRRPCLSCGSEVSLRCITSSLWQSIMQSIVLTPRPVCFSAREMKKTLPSSICDFSLPETSGGFPQSDIVRRPL